MSKRWFLIVILLLLALPAVPYAVEMGGMGGMGMGGMGAMVGKVEIQTKDVGKVTFDHRKHGTNCSQCHPKLFQKNLNNPHVTMAAMEKHRSCGFCHDGRKAFSVKSKAGCVKCHAGDILFKVPDAGDVTFPHSAHIEMYGCTECHPDLFKAEHGANQATMEDMENGQSCGACHDGDTAFSVKEACDSCHQM